MGRPAGAALGVVAIGVFVAVFFLAPVVYAYSLGSGVYHPSGPNPRTPVYVSLGCETVGIGAMYSPWYRFALACNPFDANWPIPA